MARDRCKHVPPKSRTHMIRAVTRGGGEVSMYDTCMDVRGLMGQELPESSS